MKFKLQIHDDRTDDLIKEVAYKMDADDPLDMSILRIIINSLREHWYIVLIPVSILIYMTVK